MSALSTMRRPNGIKIAAAALLACLCATASGRAAEESPLPIPPAQGEETFYLPFYKNGTLTSARAPAEVAAVLKTMVLLTLITLAPSLLLLTTCFTRIIIVLSFLRRALATQTLPPDQVLVGLALFLTIFIMAPTWEAAWRNGLKPYLEEQRDPETGRRMTQEEMLERVLAPHRDFMFACIEANKGAEEMAFFLGVYGKPLGEDETVRREEVPTHVLIPAFITSELKRAFWMGFLLYLPFLILDLVISAVIMAMGMMMLPPVMISLPFKIILFVLVDGWRLLLEGLVVSFPATNIPGA